MRRRSRLVEDECEWQGAPLALEQLEDLLEQIRHALQPCRPDIIDNAARTALCVVDQLENFWASLPPGAVPVVCTDEPREFREEREETDRERHRRERRERHQDERRERRAQRREEKRDRRERDRDDDWDDDWDDDYWDEDEDWDD